MTDFSMRNEPLYGTSSIIGITDTINEQSTGVGVTIDGVLLKDSIVSTDTINEQSAGVGVTIDGVLLKDSIVSTDTINEQSAGVGVTIDGVLLKDSIVSTDTINEQSTGVGVTIDGVLLKDSIVSTDTINEQSTGVGVTIDGVLLKDSIVNTNTISPKSGTTTTVSQDLTVNGDTNTVQLGLETLYINTGGSIVTADNVNDDVSKWLKLSIVDGGEIVYIPCYTAANTVLPTILPYVPCSSWISFGLTSGNDQDGAIVWETNSSSVDGDITINVDLDTFNVTVAGTYLVLTTIVCDMVAGVDEGSVWLRFRADTATIVDSRINIGNISNLGNYATIGVTYTGTLSPGVNYDFYVTMYYDNAYTYQGSHGSIIRLV
jgi:hypothetical protein